MQCPSLRPTFLYPLFFLSGAAGLGYQMIWMRQFTAGLGHEVPSMISMSAAFLGGMAFGAWVLDRFIAMSRAPARWYAGLEMAIGGWGMTMALLIPVLNRIALEMIGPAPSALRQWLVVFGVPFLGLLLARRRWGQRFLPWTVFWRRSSQTSGASAPVRRQYLRRRNRSCPACLCWRPCWGFARAVSCSPA
jgi:spermidine synthase